VVTYLQGFEEEAKANPFAFSSGLEQTQLLTRILANKLKVGANHRASVFKRLKRLLCRLMT
jgi:hypothetical protein